jgi:hypothetical protein
LIPPGTYLEAVFVSFESLTGTNVQERLSIQRTGTGQVVIQGSVGFPAMHLQDVENVSLKKLTLDSGNSADSVPALLIDGQTINVECRQLLGVPGDDLGVVVVGSTDLNPPTTSGVLFDRCDFSGMLRKGFWLNGVGHRIRKSVANGCGENAVVLDSFSRNGSIEDLTAVASLAQDPDDTGYVTVRGTGHRLAEVSVSGAGMHGLFLDGEGHHVQDCDADGNGDSGYFINGGSAWLEDCNASGNLFGLRGGSPGLTVGGGRYNGNSSHGLLLSGDGSHLLSLVAKGNGGHGVLVKPEAERVVMRDCTLKNNGGEGAQVEGSLTWLEDNRGKQGDGFVDLGTDNGGRDNTVQSGSTNDF